MTFAGVIEGFYGEPWSHAERLELIRFCGDEGLTTWVHAPKDDAHHRRRWRDPYPDDELRRLAQLVEAAASSGVSFEWAIAPGLSVCYSDEADFAALVAKCQQLGSIGVRAFHLLWDDIDHDLRCPEDEARYGSEPSPIAAAQAELSNRFLREALAGARLIVCPTDYAGTGPTPYRETLARLLAPQALVYWTGPEVVSRTIARADLDGAAAAFGHELVLWDNYPANDFDRERLFLGPLTGRDRALADGPLAGIVANPMNQAIPSKLPLATIADWARDPAAYDPVTSFERALERYGAEVVTALRALAGDVSGVPPDTLAGLVAALAPGVDAATGAALLERFVE